MIRDRLCREDAVALALFGAWVTGWFLAALLADQLWRR